MPKGKISSTVVLLLGWLLLLGGLLIVVANPALVARITRGRYDLQKTPRWVQKPSEPVPDLQPSAIFAQGKLEPANGLVSLVGVTGDRLESLSVNEGDVIEVTSNDRMRIVRRDGSDALLSGLGKLASYDLLEMEIAALQARIDESVALREAEQLAKTADVDAADKLVQQAESAQTQVPMLKKKADLMYKAYEQAQYELGKLEILAGRSDLVSNTDLQQKRLEVDKLRLEAEAALAEYKSTSEINTLNVLAAKSKKTSVEAGHDRALASIPSASLAKQLELLREKQKQSELVAPISGTVVKIYVRPGQIVALDPILQMADLSNMVCVAEVYESEVKRLQVGQLATIRSSAFGEPFHREGIPGRVQSIGTLIGAAQTKKLDPFAKADTRVAEVRIAIEAPEAIAVAAKLVNLQVDVEIKTEN
ncbi:MAG: efflux RND transporter periplasmic adaptor subunit [Pirellulaceae bacterium]|nr:efflux RND transporter periplasmic adaptor subunit [Planctomycetales bacterium]